MQLLLRWSIIKTD